MPGKASVIFNAETGQYIAAVEGMDAATAKAAETVAATKNKILDATRQQVQAFKEMGASAEELARIETVSSNALVKTTERNADETIRQLDRVLEKQLATKQAMKDLNLETPERGHGFTDRMATSAVVRFGEGTTSIRATENFLTMIPGAAQAAQGLALAIGAGGVLGIVEELGQAGYKAFHDLSESMRDAERGADELHERSRILIDDKEIENQKIQDQIDKIEGHPNNGLATALLEAKKNADDLIGSLKTANKEQADLFKQQDRSTTENVLHALFNYGPEGTKQQAAELNQGNRDLASRVQGYRDNLDAGLQHASTNDDRKALTDSFNAAVKRDIDKRIGELKTEYGRLDSQQKASEEAARNAGSAERSAPPKVIDNGIKKVNVQSNIRSLETLLKAQQLDDSIYDGQAKLAQDRQGKAGDKGDHSADEAARKAAEAQRQKWEMDLARQQQAKPDWTAADTQKFYQGVAPTALPGNQLDVQRQLAQSGMQAYRQDQDAWKQLWQEGQKDQREAWEQDHAAWEQAAHRTAADEANYWAAKMQGAVGEENYLEAQQRYTAALKAARDAQERADEARQKAGLQGANDQARIAEATVALEQQTGQISKYDAAVQLANIHSQQYAAQMADLQRRLDGQVALQGGSSAPDSAGTITAREAMEKASADRVVQIQTDAARTAAEQWKTELEQTNAQWVQNATDSAQQVRQLYTQAIDGFNDQASTAITGGKTNWSGYVRGLGKTVATDGLKHAEAPLLGALGLGKADGSSANPWYVKMVDGVAGLGKDPGSIFSGIANLFRGDSSSSQTADAIGQGVGRGLGAVAQSVGNGSSDAGAGAGADAAGDDFAGGFALGGDIAPSTDARSITVGEMGPERLTLGAGTAAHVTPSKDTGSGQQITHNWNIGQGVTPQQTKMYVQNALQHYHDQVMPAGAVAAVQNHNQRVPASRRTS